MDMKKQGLLLFLISIYMNIKQYKYVFFTSDQQVTMRGFYEKKNISYGIYFL